MDEAIASAVRPFRKTMASLKEQTNDALRDASAVLESGKSYGALVANELSILQTRYDALLLVNGPSKKALDDRIGRIRAGQAVVTPRSGSGGAAAASNADAGRARLGTAPPSKSYESLITVASLEPYEQQLHACASKEAIKKVNEEFKEKRKPAVELIAAAKASTRTAKTCVTSV
eukprot:379217-Alexandrium_andersonii.AAC.1